MDNAVETRHKEIIRALRATAEGVMAAPKWVRFMTVTSESRPGDIEIMIASKSGQAPSLILRVIGVDFGSARYILRADDGMRIYDSQYDEGEVVSDVVIEVVALFSRSVSLLLLFSKIDRL